MVSQLNLSKARVIKLRNELLDLEWAMGFCPRCHASKELGHKFECSLEKTLDETTIIMDDLSMGRGGIIVLQEKMK